MYSLVSIFCSMKKIGFLVLFVLALLFSGCSISTIHPPSASAFMEISEKPTLYNASVSGMGGSFNNTSGPVLYETDKVLKRHRSDYKWEYRDIEWNFEFNASMLKKKGYFRYGFGLDFTTPFVQAGFASDYFGLMGWSNLCLWQLEKYEYAYFQWGGGISLIEQLPIGDNFRMGLTQHLSRNGREAVKRVNGEFDFTPTAAPVFYDEVGGGGYISFVPGDSTRVGIEFRYGYDLTYKMVKMDYNTYKRSEPKDIHRYTVTVSLQPGW